MDPIATAVLILFVIGVIGWCIYLIIQIKNAPRM